MQMNVKKVCNTHTFLAVTYTHISLDIPLFFLYSLTMPFMSKWDIIPKDFQEQLKHIVEEIGPRQAAVKYHERCNMSFAALYGHLKAKFGNRDTPLYKPTLPYPTSSPNPRKKGEPKELSGEEEKFLTDLNEGKVSLEDASRMVAVRVFRKMLEYPDDVKFIDFFRTEMLKLKNDENKIKETWSKEIIARMFAGKLPPVNCPHCGKKTVLDSPLLKNGEDIIYDAEQAPTDS